MFQNTPSQTLMLVMIFLETVVVSHVLSAALSTLDLPDINSQPTGEGYGIPSLDHLWTHTNEEKRLCSMLSAIE